MRYILEVERTGPIRAVSSRVLDVLPEVTRGAELLHPSLDLTEQRARLMVRLEVVLPASASELAVHLGGRIMRADYLRLLRSGLGEVESIDDASDEVLLERLGDNEEKFFAVRAAVQAYRAAQSGRVPPQPILPPPEG